MRLVVAAPTMLFMSIGVEKDHGQAIESAEALPAGLKPCPRCAEDVKSAALVCRFCNYDFRASQPFAVGVAVGVEVLERRAGFFRRTTASLMDAIGLYIPIIGIWSLIGNPGGEATNLLAAAYLIGLPVYLVWSWMRGGTLAMAALGMRVVDLEGRPLTLELAMRRIGGLIVVQLAVTIALPFVLFLVFRMFRRPYWVDTVSYTKVVLAG